MPNPARIPGRLPPLLVAALIAVHVACMPGAARAEPRAACLERAAAQDLAGKTAFQRGLFDLIVDAKPEFAELAALNRDLQIALAEARVARLAYLATNDPERIEPTGTLSEFRNFDWGEADEAALRRYSDGYRALAERTTELRRRSDGHADWPRMRAVFAEGLAASAGYRALTAGLSENEATVTTILESCPSR